MLALALGAAVLAESVLLRTGLAALLSASPGLEVTRAVSPSDAETLDAEQIDVVVRDIPDDLPVDEALAAVPANVPVLALVGTAGRARELLRAGALGVVQRDTPADVLLAASVAVASGLAALDPECLRALLAPAVAESGILSARDRKST